MFAQCSCSAEPSEPIWLGFLYHTYGLNDTKKQARSAYGPYDTEHPTAASRNPVMYTSSTSRVLQTPGLPHKKSRPSHPNARYHSLPGPPSPITPGRGSLPYPLYPLLYPADSNRAGRAARARTGSSVLSGAHDMRGATRPTHPYRRRILRHRRRAFRPMAAVKRAPSSSAWACNRFRSRGIDRLQV